MSMKDNDLTHESFAVDVHFTSDSVWLELANGHFARAYLKDHPRLMAADEKQRINWSFVDGGRGVCWPELDEEMSVAKLLDMPW